MRHVFKYAVECGLYWIYGKGRPESLYHHKTLNPSINFDEVNFPANNIDTNKLIQTSLKKTADQYLISSWLA